MYKKITTMMSKKQMASLYYFIFLSFITMILETAGIGLIIPLIQSIASDGMNQQLLVFFNIFNLNPTSKHNLILILTLIIGIVYTCKVLFLTYFAYAEAKLLSDLSVSLSNKLYDVYLNKPYSFHLNNNSAKLTRNIDEIALVVGVVKASILLITEVVVFIGIATFVILYEPTGSLIIIFFLGFFGFIFFRNIQLKVKKLGKTRQTHRAIYLKYLREGLRSIRDIKILQRSNEMVKSFTANNIILNLTELKRKFISALPRLWLEWLVVISFIILILSMILLNRDLQNVVILLGLFAAAAFRILPSLTRIMNSIQNIIFYRPAVDTIYKEFSSKKFSEIKTANNKNKKAHLIKEINLNNVNFRYSTKDSILLKNINFKIKCGTAIGLIGESGVGKTTLINIILGLIKPFSGSVEVDGTNIDEDIKNWQNQIGYVPQDIYLSDDTIKNNIAFALPEEKINKQAVDRAVNNAKLEDLIRNLSNGIETKIGEFGDRISGGQRQRIAIARALYTNPKILILDEFTNSLDLKTEEKIINEVNTLKGEKTIIMIAHRLSTLKNCDYVYKLDKNGISQEKFKR